MWPALLPARISGSSVRLLRCNFVRLGCSRQPCLLPPVACSPLCLPSAGLDGIVDCKRPPRERAGPCRRQFFLLPLLLCVEGGSGMG